MACNKQSYSCKAPLAPPQYTFQESSKSCYNPTNCLGTSPDKIGPTDTQTNMLPGLPRQHNVRSKS